MNLLAAQSLAIELMDQHGLIDLKWYFEFDNSSRRFGCCNYRKHCISLSKKLVLLNEVEQVKDTILHEIAHALVGFEHGHDYVWRQKAIEIGCNGQRCYSSEDTVLVEGKYAAECPGCKRISYRHKTPKLGRMHSCGICSPRFDTRFILNWKPTHILKAEISMRENLGMCANTKAPDPVKNEKPQSDIDAAEARRLRRNEQSRLCKQRKKLGLIKNK